MATFSEIKDLSQIQMANYVFTASSGCSLDLNFLARKLSNIEYNKKKFSGAIYRDSKFRNVILIFSTGKLVITGIKEKLHVPHILKRLQKRLKNLGYSLIFENIKICNITGYHTLPFHIDLNKFYKENIKNCSYEIELFSGCSYRSNQVKKGVVILFRTGKLILTGAKCDLDLKKMFDEVKPYIDHCQFHQYIKKESLK